ncbi:Pga7 protein [Candida orthopsilosis Co 90-125]|uniref:Pga7 protein n=1 Tax=Candida orthopsilosis (strain 90-125) TaxID=1136231 RepID=H8X7U6_CANO9|nr:Pga7 protein [Candida orthopsilosis Co 90-125]CCG23882.1 Pga7 protein [Candida orthopsilosis Co 90-125]
MLYIYTLLVAALVSLVQADNYATYPKIPKTASINGFADPIVDLLPDCAKDCVKYSTKNTPCPYWDTGCFCVMPQWSGLVGQCIAKNCKGEDVQSARFLATSLCSTVGANTWMMPASISDMMSSAASGAKEVTTISGKTAMSWVTAPGSSDSNVVSETGTSGSASETGESDSETTSDSESQSESSASNSESANSASSTEASSTTSESSSTSTGSTSNIAVLQAGSLGSVIFGVLVSFLM